MPFYPTKQQKIFLKKNGYLHLKSVISQKKIFNFKKNFFNLFKHYSGYSLPCNFDNPDLAKKFKKFRQKDKKKLFYFFRTVSLTSSFHSLFDSENLKTLVSKLLKVDKLNLIFAESQFRMDEPRDKLYTLDWHQDAPYYKQDPTGKNSLVLNIAVQKHTEKMGTTLLVAGSHKNEIYKISKKNRSKSKVMQLQPSEKILKNKIHKPTFVESKPGDVTVYDMRLLHRSGYNISKKIRISIISRAFNPMSKKFKNFRYQSIILK